MQPDSPRSRQSDATRRRLVENARALWSEHGYVGASVGAILAQAGLTKGGFYHHFEDKRALFRAVVEQVEGEVLAWMSAASNAPGGAWPELRAACALHLSACLDPGVRRILLCDAPALLGPAEHAGRRLAALRSRLERALPDDPDAAGNLAPLLRGALDAAAFEAPDRERAESWQSLHTSVTLMLEGLRLVHLQGVVPSLPAGFEEREAWQAWQRRDASTPRS